MENFITNNLGHHLRLGNRTKLTFHIPQVFHGIEIICLAEMKSKFNDISTIQFHLISKYAK